MINCEQGSSSWLELWSVNGGWAVKGFMGVYWNRRIVVLKIVCQRNYNTEKHMLLDWVKLWSI